MFIKGNVLPFVSQKDSNFAKGNHRQVHFAFAGLLARRFSKTGRTIANLKIDATLSKILLSKANMRKSSIVLIILTLFASCKKEKTYPVIFGTVQQQGGCLPSTWLVHIPGDVADKYSFLCKLPSPTSSFNCSNSVYVLNMPASFAQLGKRIKFSRWNSHASCLSSSMAPQHIEVSDLRAE